MQDLTNLTRKMLTLATLEYFWQDSSYWDDGSIIRECYCPHEGDYNCTL